MSATVNIHASAVVIGDRGILVQGPSGAGKTSLCFQLVGAARAAGRFGAWIGDDRLLVRRVGQVLVAQSPPTIAGLAEQRGFGPVAVAFLPHAVIDLAVRLVDAHEAPRLPEPRQVSLAGGSLPLLSLPREREATAARAILAFLNLRDL